MANERDRVIVEITAAFLGGGDEPATWAAYAYDAGRQAGIEEAAQHFEEKYHCSECSPKEEFAASMRDLAKGGSHE